MEASVPMLEHSILDTVVLQVMTQALINYLEAVLLDMEIMIFTIIMVILMLVAETNQLQDVVMHKNGILVDLLTHHVLHIHIMDAQVEALHQEAPVYTMLQLFSKDNEV